MALISRKQYVAQRTRDVYVTSICQFETSFDLSLVIQSIDISSKNITHWINDCNDKLTIILETSIM
jgi:hypothetical protein